MLARVWFVLSFLPLLVFALPARAARPVLSAQERLRTERSVPLGRLAVSNRLDLAIGLPLRDKSALLNFVNQLYDPASANYHQYLRPEEFAARFGPTEQDYQALVDFVVASGFKVTARHRNRLLLDVSASVNDIERAFHIRMESYRHPNEPRTFYAPDAVPALDLDVPVLFIGGLNDFALPKPMCLESLPRKSLGKAEPNIGSAPDGSYMGTDFRNAYAPGVSLTGAGQTVALVQFDGFYQADITAFESLAGLPNIPIQTVLLDGYDGTPTATMGNVEVSLDIEMVISMAPGVSRVIAYEAGPTGLPEDVLSRIANDNLASQISSSWTWTAYDPNSEAIFLQFAAQGQTYFNATGDHAAFVGPITQAPSDEPYVTQVGGTALAMNGVGQSYGSETVWNRGGGIASAGGISTRYAIPSWQQEVDMSTNMGSSTMRNTPDVAMVADSVYVRYGNGAGGSFGGTSCAAPLWAGFTALMNQQAFAAGRPVVGFVNPALYHIGTNAGYANCFHDIAVGNNTWASSPSLFYAAPGYDLCTGWGTPKGSNLINAVAGAPILAPRIAPDSFAVAAETCPNGTVDPGETVVARVGLRNIGMASTSNLVATLQVTGGIASASGPVAYGVLPVGGAVGAGLFTLAVNGSCGGTATATFQLQDGNTDLGAVSFSFRLGQFSGATVLSENFDTVTPPALPAGWTVSWSGAGSAWATTATQHDTAPNSAFAPDPNSPSDNSLISPPFALAGASARLTFRHNYYTETFYDGAALEISIGGGPFTDIVAAGGSFLTNGYDHIISACCGNPLGNRGAWSGSSGGFITTIVNLPAAAAGQTVRLRWRFCSDTMIGATGWYLDTILVLDGYSCCTANQPLIVSTATSNGTISVVWLATPGRTYRLQSKSSLNAPDWSDLPGDVVASGPTAFKTDNIAPGSQRFYRVVLAP
jgi:kumamolisin